MVYLQITNELCIEAYLA